MTRILHLDASPRPGRAGTDAHGSLTRRLTHLFVTRWRALRPADSVIYRDVGASPPNPVSGDWIAAAFAPPEDHAAWMDAVLAESDVLVDELVGADVLLMGVPLYNFNVPANFKAWIDNVVRVGRTVAFDPDDAENPYTPLLADRPRHAVLLSSRGGHGFDAGAPMAHLNHLEPSVRTILEFIGITRVHSIAVEHQEDGGELLAASVRKAETRIVQLVEALADGQDSTVTEVMKVAS